MIPIKEGDPAPDFEVADENGHIRHLSEFQGKKVVLYFYPKDLTPGCTTEAKDFQASLTKIKRKKAVVLGVSRDTQAKHKKFIDKLGLKFPLLSDEKGEVCNRYGVWQTKKFMGKEFMGIARTTFVIDEAGKIKKIFPNVKVKDHVQEVLKEL